MNYNTYNMELNNIIESFNMDMFIIEHENFMNIMYKKSEGILNEAVLLELKQSKIKILINKIKEGFNKLKEKAKEILEKIKKAILSKFFSIAFSDLKKLPDDVIIREEEADLIRLINDLSLFYKNSYKKFNQLCDMISKLNDHIFYDGIDMDLKKIEDLHNEYYEYMKEFNNKNDTLITINGKYIKQNYAKILMGIKELFKYSLDAGNKYYKILNKADSKFDNIGKNHTWGTDDTVQNTIKSGDIHDIEFGDYVGGDQDLVHIANRYIRLYAFMCKDLGMISVYSFEYGSLFRDIIKDSLEALGKGARRHKGYNDNNSDGSDFDSFDDNFDDDFFEDD